MNTSRDSGFTIVELLIVIVVIAILAAIVIISYNGIVNRAHETSLKSDLRQAGEQLLLDGVQNGTYPSDLASADSGKGVKKGENTTYQYSTTSANKAFCLEGTSNKLPGKVFHFSSDDNQVVSGACAAVANEPTSCPTGFIPIPGNATYGTTGGFCVMKYEAKSNGSNVTSTAASTPRIGDSYNTFVSIASASCGSCHVITEAEWMTIAANVAGVASNWSGGSVGSGYIYSGHSDNSPASALAASANDSDGYYATGDSAADNGVTSGMIGVSQRRTLTLSNNQVIWDFAGNAWEWTSSIINGGTQPGFASDTNYSWREWNNGSLQMNALLVNSQPLSISSQAATWSSTQGIGRLYSNSNDTLTTVYQRSGGWAYGAAVGILSLALDVAPNVGDSDVGTRYTVVP